MALKNDFDNKSYWYVLVRAVAGAILGSIPGVIYILNTEQNLAANTFGVALMQIGIVTGALAFGLAAAASTIVAAVKNRNVGGAMKSSRLKEYLNPDTLPAIPPSSKPASKNSELTEVKLTPLTVASASKPPVSAEMKPEAPPQRAEEQSAERGFEDYDR